MRWEAPPPSCSSVGGEKRGTWRWLLRPARSPSFPGPPPKLALDSGQSPSLPFVSGLPLLLLPPRRRGPLPPRTFRCLITSPLIGLSPERNDHLDHGLIAEEAVQWQLDALKYNDKPRQDYGIEVMYRFAGFDPFERSTYFGPFFDLGQFERFRRIFHHSKYRVLLCHKERKILSNFWVAENRFKQRVWIDGSRPEEEETFEFTMVQRIGGSWDGYWLTESLLLDGDGFSGGIAY